MLVARHLELQFPVLAPAPNNLAQVDCPAISQLSSPLEQVHAGEFLS